jgi:hypothetical protein
MKKTIAILLTFLLTSFGIVGFSTAADYEFRIIGVVDRIDMRSGEIVVGDMLYQLSPNVLVRNHKNRLVKPEKLRQGKKIAANSHSGASYGSSNQYIHEIRLLPDNFDLSSLSADDD